MALVSEFMRGQSSVARPQLLTEINVTPIVDVMLVLLVIFMVTAPMVVTGIDVDLPDTRAKQLASDEEPLQVTLDDQQNIYVGDTIVDDEEFVAFITQVAIASESSEHRRVFVRADQTLPYGNVMTIVSQISEAGFTKVAFVSEPMVQAGVMVPQ